VDPVYDWLIGGQDHYAADRAAGRRLVTAVPGMRQAARDNRAFLACVTRYLAAEGGITQFIDIGSGLPGPGPVHEIAREAHPGARVAYVDHDPVVVAHARALLADSPLVTAIEAGPPAIRQPARVLRRRRPHPAPVTARHRPDPGTDLAMPAATPAPAIIETVISMLEKLGTTLDAAG
jgi:S-adenosyl methyltransferase